MRAPLVLALGLLLGGLFVASLLLLARPRERGPALARDPPAAVPVERALDEAGQAPPIAPTPAEVAPAAPSPVETDRAPALADDVARVAGRVLELSLGDPHGGVAAPGVEVVLGEGGRGPEIARTRTDPDGRFEFELRPGQAPRQGRLDVAGDERFRDERVVVRPERGETVEVVLRRAPHGRIHGVTVDEQGRPLGDVALRFEPRRGGRNPIELRSDLTGRFELDGIEPVHLRSARLAGYTLARASRARRQPRGGFAPIEVVMARAGELELRALDGEGQPLQGVRLAVEPAGGLPPGTPSSERRRRSSRTGVDGRVVLADVWADRALEAELDGPGGRRVVRGVVDGALVLHDDPRAEPLTVRAGARVDLVARIGLGLEVRGRVVWDDDHPAPRARARAWEPGRPSFAGGFERALRLDRDGRFSFTVPESRAGAELRVSASDQEPAPSGRRIVVTGSAGRSGARHVATRAFRAGDDVGWLELRLEPGLSISGRVTFPTGEVHAVHVRAIPAGAPHAFALPSIGEEVETLTREGAFTLSPLAPGLYDLVVSDGYGGPGELVQRFENVRAGAHEVELALEVGRDVQVRVETPPGAAVEHLVVVADRIYPRDTGSLPRSSSRRIERFTGFPRTGWIEFQGVRRWEDAPGTHRARSTGVAAGAVELKPTSPGWYTFGVAARGPDGDYALVSGGPYWLDPGAHVFEVALVPGGRLSGNLVEGEARGLAVQLLDAVDRPLPLRLHDRSVGTSASLSSRGRYRLVGLPPGAWRLAVGHESELERGRALRTFDVTVVAGEATKLDLELR